MSKASLIKKKNPPGIFKRFTNDAWKNPQEVDEVKK